MSAITLTDAQRKQVVVEATEAEITSWRGSPPTLAPVPQSIWYGYFGCNDQQIAATADHVNVVHMADWAYRDWGEQAVTDSMLTWLKQAKLANLKAIISCGYLVTDQHNELHFTGVDRLRAFRNRLIAEGLLDVVVGLYPFDEPDLHGWADPLLTLVIQQIKGAWPGPKLIVAYSDHGTPAKDVYDIVGITRYELGISGVLGNQPVIRRDQGRILVPGGADPWQWHPQLFVDYAKNAANQVAFIMPFLASDYEGGKGILTNGMLLAYRAAGKTITGK